MSKYMIELLQPDKAWVAKFSADEWDDAKTLCDQLVEDGEQARIVTQVSVRKVVDLEGNIIKALLEQK